MTNIRHANTDNISNISKALATSWRTVYRGIIADDYLDQVPDDRWVNFLNHAFDTNSNTVIVMEDEEKIIGVAIYNQTENKQECSLGCFYLLPKEIGKGLGHILYEYIESDFKDKGFKSCIIDVLENNTRAINFYTKHGYIDTGKETPVKLGNKEYICKLLEKEL